MMTKEKRHNRTNFDPAEYEYVGPMYQGFATSDAFVDEVNAYLNQGDAVGAREILDEKPFHGRWYEKGTCDHCGAVFAYGAVYLHRPTDTAICVGHTCSDHAFGHDSRREFDVAQLRKKVAQAREYAKKKAAAEKAIKDNGIEAEIETDHYIVKDIRARLFQYGKISEKQVALVKKVAAKKKEEKANCSPVVEGKRLKIQGTILSISEVENEYSPCRYGPVPTIIKMLVRTDYGAKVWGTCPESIQAAGRELNKTKQCGGGFFALRGEKIEFTANVTKSKKDDTFGIFKRPTKAKLV